MPTRTCSREQELTVRILLINIQTQGGSETTDGVLTIRQEFCGPLINTGLRIKATEHNIHGVPRLNRWFIDHQQRGVAISDMITPMLKKSSAQALRLGGLLYRVRQPGGLIVDPERVQQAMSIVDCLFGETELFHRGDGDLVDQLMDRIRTMGGEVTWERLRAKGLNRWLKENAKTRHFSEAVSNLLANDEGGLVKTKPLTWRR